MKTIEDILNEKELHSWYYPNGDSTKPMIHDRDCHFCDYESLVKDAITEFTDQEKQAEAIKFMEWCVSNKDVYYTSSLYCEYKNKMTTTEQLYQLYISSLK